jgi:Tol biopolymer transport system component
VTFRVGTRIFIVALGVFCAACAMAWAAPGAREPGFTGWSQVRSEHFVFVYEDRDRDAVRELLSFAEDVYGEVTLFLESAPRQVWVVVRGRVDAANGYTAASPPHIVLYVAPPSEPLFGLDASSRLRLLFVHEFTHFVNFQFDRGILSVGEKIFGPGVKEAEAFLYGYAMMEGIATVTETLFTDGGRGRNPFFELEPRGLALDHAFFPLRRVSYGSSFPPLDRVWLGGYLFVRYLLDRYGPDVMKNIHAAYAASPLLGPWAAVRRVTGRDAKELFQDMVGDLEERYRGREAIEAGRRLSPSGIGDYFLPVVTDAGWFLYRRTQGDPGAIVRWDPPTGKEQVVLATSMSDPSSLTASRDGSQIVFSADEQAVGKSGPILLSDLYALDPTTRAVRRITVGAHLWQPRLSPDGSTLIAVQAAGARTRLVLVDRVSGDVAVLYARSGATVCTPAFSPDGRRVAFVEQAGGRNDILVLSLPIQGMPVVAGDGFADVNVDAAAKLLPRGTGREYYPSFLDDDTVAFSSDRDSALALYAVRSADDEPTLICEDPVGAWAGEGVGGKIVYGTWRSSGFTLMEKGPVQEPAGAGREKTSASSPSVPDMPTAGRYVDWPRFIYWSPLPFYLSSIASSELLLAPGVLLGALSTLEKTSLTASMGFRTDWLQPAVELDFATRLGTTSLSYLLSEGFTTTALGASSEQLQQQLALSFPLVRSTALHTMTRLVASTGIADSIIIQGAAPFNFMEGFTAGASGSALTFEHDAGILAGLSYVRSVSGSDRDLFTPNALVASALAVFYPPVVSDTGMGAVASGVVSLAFPSPFPHQVIKLGLKTSYVTFGKPFIRITNPRGDFDPAIQVPPGRTLLSLDYQFPIALLDVPLVYTLGLVALGGGMHVEAAADWSPSTAALFPDTYIYAGMELVFVLSVGEGEIPVLFGASVRFDPLLANPFDWSTDIRPYIVLSTDSFAGVGFAERAGRAPAYIRAR